VLCVQRGDRAAFASSIKIQSINDEPNPAMPTSVRLSLPGMKMNGHQRSPPVEAAAVLTCCYYRRPSVSRSLRRASRRRACGVRPTTNYNGCLLRRVNSSDIQLYIHLSLSARRRTLETLACRVGALIHFSNTPGVRPFQTLPVTLTHTPSHARTHSHHLTSPRSLEPPPSYIPAEEEGFWLHS